MKTTVRKVEKNGAEVWMLEHRDGAKRQRRFYTSKATAEAEAAQLRAQVEAHGAVLGSLGQKDRTEVSVVLSEMDAAGVDLRQVWDDWRTGAIRRRGPAVTLAHAIDECLAAKTTARRRDGYVKDLEHLLKAFARDRGKTTDIAAITAPEIERWLSRYDNAHSLATGRNRINTLFSFAVRRGYVEKNPCDSIERVTIDYQAPQILTTGETAKLLTEVLRQYPRHLASVTLSLLGGIRPEETDRLTWDAVDLEQGMVTIDAAASKVRQRRLVHLMPSAVAWLRKAHEVASDLPCPNIARRRMQRDVRGVMGWASWPQDILRHSAASYWLALSQDAGKVAHELGNSVGVLLRHYRELVKRDDAAKFWSITPETLAAAA